MRKNHYEIVDFCLLLQRNFISRSLRMEDKQSMLEILDDQNEHTPAEVCELIADYALSFFKKGDLIDCRAGYTI
jgi:hypothetical protein